MAAVLRRLTIERFHQAEDHDERYFEDGFPDADRYFARFEGALNVHGSTVLDVGCGYGSLCMRAAELGARRSVGIDINPKFVALAEGHLGGDYAHLGDRVEFHHVDRSGLETDERFDVVLSKDSFEHIADPEAYIHTMKGYLRPGGLLAIGFGPLWRSPYGAHQKWMSPVPWVHLVFPEPVVIAERRRLGFPDGARSYAEAAGGLNKMTLGRFRRITTDPELDPVFFKVNQTASRAGRVLELMRRVPGLGELCAFNVYATWRYRPAASSAA